MKSTKTKKVPGAEEQVAKRYRKSIVTKTILATIGIAGILAMGAIAPNAVQALTLLSGFRKKSYHLGSYINRCIFKLKNKGLITTVTEDGKTYLRLTNAGERELAHYTLREKKIPKPRRWDKKWRLVIFDIREYRRATRDSLRDDLVSLGLVRLQNSVWVTPYPCDDIIIMLKAHHEIGKDVLYIIAEHLENDRWLREHFSLSQG